MKHLPAVSLAKPFVLATFLALLISPGAGSVKAAPQIPAVDPAATKILKRATDYLGSLKQFSVDTQNTLEEQLESGHRIDLDVSAHAMVRRPNKIRSERRGGLIDQRFCYDGKTLTLHNPTDKVYATVPAPATIAELLDYVRETLELIIPAADLVYTNSYALLMQDVTFASVVGKAVINGVTCDHLLFSKPGVDFQLWVAASGKPLVHKYVVTDTGIAAQLSLVTLMSNWNVAPGLTDADFAFTPPPGAQPITFLPLLTVGNPDR